MSLLSSISRISFLFLFGTTIYTVRRAFVLILEACKWHPLRRKKEKRKSQMKSGHQGLLISQMAPQVFFSFVASSLILCSRVIQLSAYGTPLLRCPTTSSVGTNVYSLSLPPSKTNNWSLMTPLRNKLPIPWLKQKGEHCWCFFSFFFPLYFHSGIFIGPILFSLK